MPVENFLDKCRREMRLQRLSKRTEETYLRTIRRYIEFHGGKSHPKDMGATEIRDYLSHLANDQDVAASTQDVAFNALLFLYRNILCIEMPQITGVDRVQRPPRLPEVFTREEVNAVLSHLQSTNVLMASLLYGSGLRLMECMRRRFKDIDLARHELTVREGKGDKDRVTMLPLSQEKPLQRQLVIAKAIHDEDLAAGYGSVWLPHALERKYANTSRDWSWQYVFPASRLSIDPRSGETRRHHRDEETLQKAVHSAVNQAGITRRASCHTFWKTATTSAPCRNCSAMRMFPPP